MDKPNIGEIGEEGEGGLAGDYSLTRKERMAVEHLVKELGWEYEELKRNPTGIDFTYRGSLGVEVKGDGSYNLSYNQLEDINNHEATVILVVKNRGCWVEEMIKGVDMVKDRKKQSKELDKFLEE